MEKSRIAKDRKKLRERTNRAKLKFQKDRFDEIAEKYKNVMIYLSCKDERDSFCRNNIQPQNHN
jgi:hypothetical protein